IEHLLHGISDYKQSLRRMYEDSIPICFGLGTFCKFSVCCIFGFWRILRDVRDVRVWPSVNYTERKSQNRMELAWRKFRHLLAQRDGNLHIAFRIGWRCWKLEIGRAGIV